LAVATLVGTTAAYFNASASSPDNVFTTGSLSVALSENTGLVWDDWQPGETKELSFTITNTGSMPIYVKGRFDGSWDANELSSSVISLAKIEYWYESVWYSLGQTPWGIGEEFFYSPTGTEADLTMLVGGETTQFKVIVKFDPEAGNEYQNHIFTGALHLAARQVTDGASWPAQY
jgi:predicted ribosomally synthesized peptide with SipW-like signal peptide